MPAGACPLLLRLHGWLLLMRIDLVDDRPPPLQVNSQIKLICPLTLRMVDVPGSFPSLPCAPGNVHRCAVGVSFTHMRNSRSLVEFVVLDVAPEVGCNGKVLAPPRAFPELVCIA